jgi:hypothetical protein
MFGASGQQAGFEQKSSRVCLKVMFGFELQNKQGIDFFQEILFLS